LGDTCHAVAMIKRSVDRSRKDWFIGPWDSDVPVALGYADEGVDDPHVHDSMYEIYFIARGTSSALVDGQLVDLQAGDVLVVEPGETHTFVDSSDDYLHFVVQAPFVQGDKRRA
jgi:mannose-6-phosphate isomerase-like protein (cupin superfamily)